MFHDYSDEELIKSIKTKIMSGTILSECNEIEEIYKRYNKKLINFIYKLTFNNNISHDLLNETFLKLFLNINKFNSKWRFSTWVYKIAANTAIDYIRKNKEESLDNSIQIKDQKSLSIEDEIDKDFLYERVRNILDKIPWKPRTVFILKFYEDMNYKEIAKVLSCSERNIKRIIKKWGNYIKDRINEYL